MFDVARLHIGHLAKAFGLRDRPGEIPGQSGAGAGAGARSSATGQARKNDGERGRGDRMRTGARLLVQKGGVKGLASEFNIQ